MVHCGSSQTRIKISTQDDGSWSTKAKKGIDLTDQLAFYFLLVFEKATRMIYIEHSKFTAFYTISLKTDITCVCTVTVEGDATSPLDKGPLCKAPDISPLIVTLGITELSVRACWSFWACTAFWSFNCCCCDIALITWTRHQPSFTHSSVWQLYKKRASSTNCYLLQRLNWINIRKVLLWSIIWSCTTISLW